MPSSTELYQLASKTKSINVIESKVPRIKSNAHRIEDEAHAIHNEIPNHQNKNDVGQKLHILSQVVCNNTHIAFLGYFLDYSMWVSVQLFFIGH